MIINVKIMSIKRKSAEKIFTKNASPFSPVRSIRLYETIIRQISQIVKDGHLKNGDRFPAERTLEEELQVSRPVLREAFRVLEMEGYVESRPGGGRYLRSENIPDLREIKISRLKNTRLPLLQIWEAREALEIRTAMLAAKNASEKQLKGIERPLILIEKMSHEEYRQGDFNLDIHLAIAKASGNPLLEELIYNLMNRFRKVNFKDLLELSSWSNLQKEHRPILDAIVERNPEKAAQAMSAHFSSLRNILEEQNET